METIAYHEFSAELHRNVIAARSPATATVEVTRRCPLECAHCYNNLPMSDHGARKREMTFDEHCRLIDEMVAAGCIWLLYTGGEIFARPDFLEIYTYAKRQGLLITLFTNGTLITPKIADYLAEWRPFSIEITLYGRTRETYELLTGVPGSFDKCMRGIALLRERGLPLKLKTVAVTLNKHEVLGMKHFAEEDLGVEFRYDSLMSPRIDCSQSPLAVRLKPEEIVEFDLADPDRLAKWREIAASLSQPAKSEEAVSRSDELYSCGGGLTAFAIDPEGEMSICTLSHRESFNVRGGNFTRSWDTLAGEVRTRKRTRLTKCVTCQMAATCGMCPASGELENGDAEKPVDFLCQVSHLRALTLDMPIAPHGDCEYCEGGHGHEKLQRAAVALRQRAKEARLQVNVRRYLPVIADKPNAASCATGGCGSCA